MYFPNKIFIGIGQKGEKMFLPTTKEEMKQRGWDVLDVILISGDTYIDAPQNGIAVIGRVLEDAGYRVGIIAQPDISEGNSDIARLGEPRLFWGVSAGALDSMVANFTSGQKRRQKDDLTPGVTNHFRPDRATIVYSNEIRKHFKDTAPIVLGGVEASLRRLPHYDVWQDKIRNSVLFDSKADYLIYGMGEKPILELAEALSQEKSVKDIRGLCYIDTEMRSDFIILPSFEEIKSDKEAFTKMFKVFYRESRPEGSGLSIQVDNRYLMMNPPALPMSSEELDHVNELPYERAVHPYYLKMGEVRSLNTIQFSINTHRGCFGECSFCAIAVHEGKTVQSRSEDSVVREAEKLARHPDFKGMISLSAPTINMYQAECRQFENHCKNGKCLMPKLCANLKLSHHRLMELLKKLRKIEGVTKVNAGSGLRFDMLCQDEEWGEHFTKYITKYHVGGQLKIAPEHSVPRVLELMGKPKDSAHWLLDFKKLFDKASEDSALQQYLTYYFIAGHPGSTAEDMQSARNFSKKHLGILPKQTQIFTPTPSTISTLMYYTGKDLDGNEIFVEKKLSGLMEQKGILVDREDKKQFSSENNYRDRKSSYHGGEKKRNYRDSNNRSSGRNHSHRDGEPSFNRDENSENKKYTEKRKNYKRSKDGNRINDHTGGGRKGYYERMEKKQGKRNENQTENSEKKSSSYEHKKNFSKKNFSKSSGKNFKSTNSNSENRNSENRNTKNSEKKKNGFRGQQYQKKSGTYFKKNREENKE